MRTCLPMLTFLVLATTHSVLRAEESFFEKRIAPVLRLRCVSCHNPEKSKGDLDLSSRAAVLKGGEEGPALVPGKPADSLLLSKVSGPRPKMPRGGEPLTADQIADLRQWIADGAHWPDNLRLAPAPVNRSGADWWAYRPVVRPQLPKVNHAGWVRTPIDAFILARLEANGLTPAPEVDRATLIRRLSYDLHGLPPMPEEIDAFLNDNAAGAYEKLVDRLLASPRYGERWGRHWLDTVHYGDTHGYDKDKRRPNAWPYRDYVIASFNADKSYSRFIREQLAGDVFYPNEPEAIIATGFIAAGPWDFVGHVELREGTVDKEITRLLDRDDMVCNTASSFLSLTVGCARCHDHKFDPISQQDYYRLQAVFAGVERGDRPYRRPEKSPPLMTYAAVPHVPRPIHVLHRGNVSAPRDPVGPGALALVRELEAEFKLPRPDDEGARRAALAEWITSTKNPLTRRSLVNRVWSYHFGKGIVDTPNDFGFNGGRPSHPELLDWLASEFLDTGESIKKLHRLIVTSAVYRQSSQPHPKHAAIDADNRLLWRMNRGRLDAESLRDALLLVSGKLDPLPGGPGFDLFRFKDDHSPIYDYATFDKTEHPGTARRTVYRFVVRSVPNPFLECLDCADPNISTPVRNTTNTALQALALLNDPFVVRQAEHFAGRLNQVQGDETLKVEVAYRLALGRLPTADEKAMLSAYAAKHGLPQMCRLLFNTNEFLFVD